MLNVAMTMAGDGAVRPVDNNDEKGIVHFNCPPRPISFRYSYDTDRRDPIIQPGIIADEEFSALSPFTTWTLDFGLKHNLNKFLNLAELQTIELHFNGHRLRPPSPAFNQAKVMLACDQSFKPVWIQCAMSSTHPSGRNG